MNQKQSPSGPRPPTPAEKSPEAPGIAKAKPRMLSVSEASKALGMHPRTFRKLRARYGPIAGAEMVEGAWFFPEPAIEQLRELEDQEDLDVEDGIAQLLHEAVKASREVQESNRAAYATTAQAVAAAVEAIKGTDHRTALMIQENKRMGDAIDGAHKTTLEAVTLVKDLIMALAELEAEAIKSKADQTVRIERTKVAAKGMNLLGPVVKKGIARFLRDPAIADEADSQGLLEIMRSLKETPEKLAELAGTLDEEQQGAMQTILGFAEGAEKLKSALTTLKHRMTPEQGEKLQGILTQRQFSALASVFEDLDEPEEKKEPEKKSA